MEQLGIPTVTICSEVFYQLAKAEAEARGVPNLAIVKVPHPIGSVASEKAFGYGQNVAVEVSQALVQQVEEREASSLENVAEDVISIKFEAKEPLAFFDRVNEYFVEKKWTDGLPVVPPTQGRVSKMLEHTKNKPYDLLGAFAPTWAITTVEKVAVNAVMAGCKPEYFPVVLSAVKALLEPKFNLYAIQATTNPATPLLVVNGPIAKKLGMECKANVFGQGNSVNLTIGRAIRLCMMNIGGAMPGELDRATQGQPGKISFCIAENEEENPWQPYHIETGYTSEQSTVSVFAVAGTHNILDETSTNAQNLLLMIAGSMTPLGTNNLCIGGEVLIVLSPEHAKLIEQSEFSKNDVKKFLYDNARIPLGQLPNETKHQLLLKRRPKWFSHVPNHYCVPVVDDPQDIKIIVAGGHGPHSTFMPSFGAASRAVTCLIEKETNG